MAPEVVSGICVLLKEVNYQEIIRNSIRACTYISMNYEFIRRSELSLDVLVSMMKLLGMVED